MLVLRVVKAKYSALSREAIGPCFFVEGARGDRQKGASLDWGERCEVEGVSPQGSDYGTALGDDVIDASAFYNLAHMPCHSRKYTSGERIGSKGRRVVRSTTEYNIQILLKGFQVSTAVLIRSHQGGRTPCYRPTRLTAQHPTMRLCPQPHRPSPLSKAPRVHTAKPSPRLSSSGG